MHEESTRLAGEHKGGRVRSNFYLPKIRDYNFQCLYVKCTWTNCCASQKIRDYYLLCLFVKCTCDVILSTEVSPACCTVHTFRSPRDAETRRAWQQQQANVNAAAEAAALQAMLEESTRLAGEHEGGRVPSNFYLTKIRDYNFQCLCVKFTWTNCCAIKKIRDYYLLCLFVKCTCDVILSTKVLNITALCAS